MMRRNLRLFMLLFVCILLHKVFVVYAGGPGTTAAQFLRIDTGVRAIGMSGAYTGLASGADAIYWNPAGLSQIKSKEISFMHTVWLEEIKYDHLVFGHPLKGHSAFGLGIDYLSMSPIEKIDIDGNPVNETYRPSDFAFNLSWAKKISKMSIGLNFKFIQSKIESEKTNALALDMGWIYKLNHKFSLGLVTKNSGTKMKFRDKKYPLAADTTLGLAFFPLKEKLTFALDLCIPVDNKPYGRIGTEYQCKFGSSFNLAFRGGYKSNNKGLDNLTGISTGLGISWDNFGLDYAWVPFGELGQTHHISISMRLPSVSALVRKKKYFTTAHELYKKREYEKAIDFWRKVLRIDPNHRESEKYIKLAKKKMYFTQGHQLFIQKRYTESIEWFKKVMGVDPNHRESEKYMKLAKKKMCFTQGYKLFTQQKYREAIIWFRKVLEVDPGHSESKKYIKRAKEKIKQ